MNNADKMLMRIRNEPKLMEKYHKRLFTNSRLDEETGCWNTLYGANVSEPQMGVEGIMIRCPRLSYTIMKGVIPEGLSILHICDNPRCVNPEHIFPGTTQDNMSDKVNKNRQRKGGQIATCKLTEADALKIKKGLAKGLTGVYLAKLFSVSPRLIGYIKQGKIWAHVEIKNTEANYGE